MRVRGKRFGYESLRTTVMFLEEDPNTGQKFVKNNMNNDVG